MRKPGGEKGRVGGARRTLLITLLALGVALLVVAIVIALPILTHKSAGGSGQQLPQHFESTTSAEGADHRVRELTVTSGGKAADLADIRPGDKLRVRGTGFDPGIGIYLAICKIPEKGEKPGPCLGGIPEGATEGKVDKSALSSAWITSDWAWRAFATHSWGDGGSFDVTLTVPPSSTGELDCRTEKCAITTRADHTALQDRVQDMLLPVRFAGE